MEDGSERPSTTGDADDRPRIYERMRLRMLRLFGHQQWLEDVVQSAYATFLEKRDTLRDASREEAFADRIALNKARDEMRRHKRTALLNDLYLTQGDWPALAPTPEAVTQDRDRIRRLNDILERLGPRYRVVYLLHHVECLSIAEIAESEGISVHAVKKRLARARRMIHGRARKDPVLSEWLETLGGPER